MFVMLHESGLTIYPRKTKMKQSFKLGQEGQITRSANYNTKQREAILKYIASLESVHVTAAQIEEHFINEGAPIGRTTIYRHLDKLEETGKVRKYITDGMSGACYQHSENKDGCRFHFHLKCENCGELQHVECDELNELQRHILDDHAFEINALKTVFYGKCRNCLQTDKKEKRR